MVDASPYTWPCDGPLRSESTALIIIDMQVDFCGRGGYVDRMGYDIQLTRAPIEPLQRVLAAARAAGMLVIHTREGHRRSLVDLPENKRWRSSAIGAEIGKAGPCGRVLTRGEPGWEIIPELAPLPTEELLDKPGKGCFWATDLDHLLRCSGVTRLLIGGITTDVCVHTTMREGNDRGYECCLITDGTAATDPSNHSAALNMVKMQGGVFGAVASADAICKALALLPPTKRKPELKGHSAVTGKVCQVPSAKPMPFTFPVGKLALLMIDWQRDFLEPGGFGESLGNDVGLLRAGLPAAAAVLTAARSAKVPVFHTLEAHKPDLSDCPMSKRRRCTAIGKKVDEELGRVLIAGEPGNGIVPEVAPVPGEVQIHKPGKGTFYATGFGEQLQAMGITHLLVTGVTTEVCVQTTVREASDRGIECLVVTDATESYFPQFKTSALEMFVAQNAIVCWTADSEAVVKVLKECESQN